MTFTKEQMEILSKFEEHFRTATKSAWSRHPGRTNLRTIYDIFTTATGDKRRYDDCCQHCILSLLRDCGVIYFKDKASLEEMKKVEAKDIKVKKARVKVKTTKK